MTPEQLSQILPNCKDPDTWAYELDQILPQYGVVTKEQVASFLSQVGHESAHLNILSENLNYSVQGLRNVFGKYFPSEAMAIKYARQPRAIASRVYANRMGNGSEQSQDGWLYRGRGLIMLTGKSNYTACSLDLFGDHRLVAYPDLLTEPRYAIMGACWFWNANDLNRYAGDVRTTTKRVNGGYNGLADRIEIYERAMSVL
jgi:putative chitinase